MIAFDSQSGVTGGVSATVSHTCSGTDRILFAVVTAEFGNGTNTCTYNGVTMTLLQSLTGVNSYKIFYMINPPTGTFNLVGRAFGSPCTVWGISLTGVDQTAPINANTSTTSASTASFSPAITTMVNDSYVIVMGRGSGSQTITGISPAVARRQPNLSGGRGAIWDSGGSTGAAGAKSIGVTSTAQSYEGVFLVSLTPVPESSTAHTRRRMLMAMM